MIVRGEKVKGLPDRRDVIVEESDGVLEDRILVVVLPRAGISAEEVLRSHESV